MRPLDRVAMAMAPMVATSSERAAELDGQQVVGEQQAAEVATFAAGNGLSPRQQVDLRGTPSLQFRRRARIADSAHSSRRRRPVVSSRTDVAGAVAIASCRSRGPPSFDGAGGGVQLGLGLQLGDRRGGCSRRGPATLHRVVDATGPSSV